METVTIIVGAGPAGLATAACLQHFSIPSIILEKEDCCASLWKNRSYDRLKLHLAKVFCSLPHMPIPSSAPTFVGKQDFIQYIDNYVAKFKLEPFYCRNVMSSTYDNLSQRWRVEVKNTILDQVEVYNAQFLVVASGENSKGVMPELPGFDRFRGETIHSCQYKSGAHFKGKKALVVGCGNSGMEIAYDLYNHMVDTSIVVRNPVQFHILNKELVYIGMTLLKFLPISLVDRLVLLLARLVYGDLSKYGLQRPERGPFHLKCTTGRSPVIDVGTVKKLKEGQIKVYPGISSIKEDRVMFERGEEAKFDALIFATGYRSSANNWLKDFCHIFNANGMPKKRFPNHWKGENGLYCAGFSQRGLAGISWDAKTIADDIGSIIAGQKKIF